MRRPGAASYGRLWLWWLVPIFQHDLDRSGSIFVDVRSLGYQAVSPRCKVCAIISDRAERLVQTNQERRIMAIKKTSVLGAIEERETEPQATQGTGTAGVCRRLA
jgi:hypothetical protein